MRRQRLRRALAMPRLWERRYIAPFGRAVLMAIPCRCVAREDSSLPYVRRLSPAAFCRGGVARRLVALFAAARRRWRGFDGNEGVGMPMRRKKRSALLEPTCHGWKRLSPIAWGWVTSAARNGWTNAATIQCFWATSSTTVCDAFWRIFKKRVEARQLPSLLLFLCLAATIPFDCWLSIITRDKIWRVRFCLRALLGSKIGYDWCPHHCRARKQLFDFIWLATGDEISSSLFFMYSNNHPFLGFPILRNQW